MGKLIPNHFIGNNGPEFYNRLLGSYFIKLTLGGRFPDQSLSNQSFKQNSCIYHLGFVTVITQKANTCSPWTPC